MNYLTSTTWLELFELPKKLQNIDFTKLWNSHPPNFEKVKVWGKTFNTPRYQKCYGKNYKYSGVMHTSTPIPDDYNELIEYFSNRYDCEYNMMLINWYENGNHYIGFHSDNEKNLNFEAPIITISLGASRNFVIKSNDKTFKKKIELKNYDVLVMGGTFQKTHLHGIPKQKKIKDPRISITLRVFN